jgi:hypothetical protein
LIYKCRLCLSSRAAHDQLRVVDPAWCGTAQLTCLHDPAYSLPDKEMYIVDMQYKCCIGKSQSDKIVRYKDLLYVTQLSITSLFSIKKSTGTHRKKKDLAECPESVSTLIKHHKAKIDVTGTVPYKRSNSTFIPVGTRTGTGIG